MGSIPLPALDIKPPESPLDTYSKIAGIKSMLQQQQLQAQTLQQRQQMAPLEQQQAQQQVQGGAVDLQSKQLQLQMQQLDVKDRMGLANIYNGVYGGALGGKQSGNTPSDGSTSPNGTAQSAPLPGAPAGAQPTAPIGQGMGAFPNPPAGAPQESQTSAPAQSGPVTIPAPSADRFGDMLARVQASDQISPQAKMAFTKQVTDLQDQVAKKTKDETDAQEAVQKQAAQALQSVLSAKTEDQPYQYGLELNNLRRSSNPAVAQLAQQLPSQFPGTDQLMRTAQGFMASNDFNAYVKQKAEQPGQEAESTQKVQAAAAPTMQQIQDATRTIGTYTGISAPERQGLIAEVQHAPDWAHMQATVARADAAQATGEMKQATMAQAKAIMGDKFGEAGLTANEKNWSDLQHGYAGAIAQINQTKAAMTAGANGNALITNMIPTMEVLSINHSGGMNRIQPQEALAAGVSPEWTTRWNAWATKAMTGKLTPELAKEGNQLMDIVGDAAFKRAVTSSQLIANGHGLTDYSHVPAMDRNGNVTTLDQVARGGGASGGSAPSSGGSTQANTSDPFSVFGGKAHPQ